MLRVLVVALALAVAPAHAWGREGHIMTARIAQSLLSADAAAAVVALGFPGGLLEAEVNWADEVKYDAGWRWSAPLHYVNTRDDPPAHCSFIYARDCGADNACVVGAISNYTRLLLTPHLSTASRYIAAKFLIHFIGDVHQPLHVCGKDEGGNTLDVTWFAVADELHSVWDTGIIEHKTELVGGGYDGFEAYLRAQLESHYPVSQQNAWVACQRAQETVNVSSILCPSQWATTGNADICSGRLWVANNSALAANYYNANLDEVTLRLLQAGLRMAFALNTVFAKRTNTTDHVDIDVVNVETNNHNHNHNNNNNNNNNDAALKYLDDDSARDWLWRRAHGSEVTQRALAEQRERRRNNNNIGNIGNNNGNEKKKKNSRSTNINNINNINNNNNVVLV